ncbi:alpha-galactosidase 2 [Pyrenophora seminiperda CCB06]|uniref:Acyl-coenzyme A diphosphatase SCS3 n=1 Tax=Pyrenophora seminiperda CCB06 TaxID=1302712 RepID=A0A3M7M677_9PLEO|nr:alpha-galactosidase 2 [Pyrenophora seminiperda CCB06]
MATRRKPEASDGDTTQFSANTSSGTMRPPTSSARRSPFLPTRLEAQLIAIYPITLLLGSIFSTLSPSTRSAPYSASLQSHPVEFAPSYFAQKKNVFNVYFVKVGWFWATLAFAFFVTLHPGFGQGASARRIRAVLRYSLVTMWWCFLTQWFFGPPLIDRGFRITGGQCELLRQPGAREDMSNTREYITAATCKAVGGTWKGGHDISGHVFLLILGSSLLWLEFLPALTRVEGLRDGRLITLPDGKVASVAVEKELVKEEGEATARGVKFALGVAGLMWWMLLMTAAYFHTWFEKFTGLLVAFVGLRPAIESLARHAWRLNHCHGKSDDIRIASALSDVKESGSHGLDDIVDELSTAINAAGTNFTLTADGMSYLFHVDTDTGDLISDHFGGPTTDFTPPAKINPSGWVAGIGNARREFPDIGRGDFRLPAIHIEHADGDTVTAFRYQSHDIVDGKPGLPGLPATYGEAGNVTTVIVHMYDNVSDVSAALSYSIFPRYNAIARSFSITNNGSNDIVIERASSFSTDFPNLELEMIEPYGDWSHEFQTVKRKIDYGETSFRSTAGYASHLHNPFFTLVSPTTTESTGEAWGFSLVWTGSFAATAQRFANGYVRVLMGLNSLHASIRVAPGATFQSPEAVGVYSSEGVGGMSRSFHDLYRNHLSRSKFTSQTRPVLLNSWEVNKFNVLNTSTPLQFGIWVEPEMVNPNSTLYNEHPDWVLHAGKHQRTLTRNQLVLNVGMPEVQDFIIDSVSRVLDSANIQYVKWDNNRGMHELARPSDDYTYILGLYRVIDTLTTKYPNVLFEGCASGGGRFDPGLLHYWAQHWTSDNTDASNRLTIQMGTSLVYPPSAMGCHVSAVPNQLTKRNISITYRGHVAMMCGSFGLELNPSELSAEETALIPSIMAEAKAVNPIVISGHFYRLAHPDTSNWPAVMFVSKDGSEAVVFAFQQMYMVKPAAPPLKLQGLDPKARYSNDGDNATYSGATYMNGGVNVAWPQGDYQSSLIWLRKV